MSPTLAEPTVCVVDDDPAVREVVRWLTESVHLRVEAFATAQEFLQSYQPHRPGCLVLDVRMPGMSGFELQRELAHRKITIPIILLTGYAEVPSAVQAVKAGAFDFIQKPFSQQELLTRIQEAVEVDTAFRRAQMAQAEMAARLAHLTPRQREVLARVVAGNPTKVIASEMGLSPRTVDVHRSRIMRRLGVESLAHLFRATLPSWDTSAAKPTPGPWRSGSLKSQPRKRRDES